MASFDYSTDSGGSRGQEAMAPTQNDDRFLKDCISYMHMRVVCALLSLAELCNHYETVAENSVKIP